MKPLTIQEAAEYLSCSTDTIRRMVVKGQIRAMRVGTGRRNLRFWPAHLIEDLSAQRATVTISSPFRPKVVL